MGAKEHLINKKKAKVQLIKDSRGFKAYRFYTKMIKNDIKYHNKKLKDLQEIQKLIGEIKTNDNIFLFSNIFDVPNLLLYFNKIFTIEEIVISTWAITDKGLATIKYFDDKNIQVKLLLDKVYSYKWIFKSGAYDYLKNIKLRFAQNHSKVLLIKTTEQFIVVQGSMNFTNNPRYENVNIISNEDIYNFFYDQFNKFFTDGSHKTYKQTSLFQSKTEFRKIN